MVVTLLSLCIAIPALFGAIKVSRIDPAFYPFLFCLWLGTVNEILGIVLINFNYYNTVNTNIYLLLESFLITWQFKKWHLLGSKNLLMYLIFSALILLWITENFIIGNITVFNSYFRIGYSTAIVFMSTGMMNKLIATERKSLAKNSIFIICTAYIIFYTFSILSEVFWVYGLGENKNFMNSVYNIAVVSNFLSIILFTFSIIWIPIKQRFTLPSS